MKDYQAQLDTLNQAGLQRGVSETLPQANGYCTFNGQRMLNLSSNDYLGLNTDPTFKADFLQHIEPELMAFGGSGSSRLLTGNSPLYTRLENAVVDWLGKPNSKALFFNSGYHANVGILPALCDKKDLIISDKLCHASLLDGIRLSAATHLRFRHNDMTHLAHILASKRQHYRRVFIVTESLFSMDGDVTDIAQLVALKQRYDAMLYLDEAHAIGAIGNHGKGLADSQQHLADIDIMVCPMGKAMASQGAMVITNPTLHQLLINTCRTLIFTTALPPITVAWSTFVIENMPHFDEKRQALSQLKTHVNRRLADYNLPPSDSYIVPIIVGDNHKTVDLAQHLRANDFLVFPIRPPTVAKNTARLRLTLTADMPVAGVLAAIDCIGDFLSEHS